ncbi:MAG: hypothetical protein EZS28_044029 [Streblomastix strix]|uniref:Uncharacterized protein n=1 Tax=Streblomastix strix TaxID=222440 RepID=A0A5J4TPS4_9EUKA|nr:MAG: hypothetical protein EZS28_044029 [Streblomastix strix]
MAFLSFCVWWEDSIGKWQRSKEVYVQANITVRFLEIGMFEMVMLGDRLNVRKSDSVGWPHVLAISYLG